MIKKLTKGIKEVLVGLVIINLCTFCRESSTINAEPLAETYSDNWKNNNMIVISDYGCNYCNELLVKKMGEMSDSLNLEVVVEANGNRFDISPVLNNVKNLRIHQTFNTDFSEHLKQSNSFFYFPKSLKIIPVTIETIPMIDSLLKVNVVMSKNLN
ncbi:MAG: hypothetical protein ACI9G9_000138 [Psychromonas sp.]|jgi:hypothetical protein